jgi:hypothetical protein
MCFSYGFEATTEKIVSDCFITSQKQKKLTLLQRIKHHQTHERSFTKGNTVVKEGLVRDNVINFSSRSVQ